MNDIDLTKLKDKIDEIRKKLNAAKETEGKLSEANSENRIIYPLLHALDYDDWDYDKQAHDSIANNFPDYTLLPNTPQKWFLEVKKLDLPLQDSQAAQAVNYAHNAGSQWAVLTNGRKWIIYNAHSTKPLAEKKVFEIPDLFADDADLKTFTLLSRTSMLENGLHAAWVF